MTTYIALLRAVNLGPHNKIGMSDLRELLTGLGVQGVRTLLQSGNAVFQSDARTTAPLERLIESAAANQLHVETDVMIRSHKEWKGIIASNPFRKEAKQDRRTRVTSSSCRSRGRPPAERPAPFRPRSSDTRWFASMAAAPTSSTRMASVVRS